MPIDYVHCIVNGFVQTLSPRSHPIYLNLISKDPLFHRWWFNSSKKLIFGDENTVEGSCHYLPVKSADTVAGAAGVLRAAEGMRCTHTRPPGCVPSTLANHLVFPASHIRAFKIRERNITIFQQHGFMF